MSSTVERNLVYGGASAAIEIGGGPALVRNNVVIGAAGGGIVSYDYGGRGLVRGVHIVGNTAIGARGAAFDTSGWAAGADLELRDNAGLQRDGGAAFPDPIDGIPMDGNLTCGADCFVDEAKLDLWPTADGGLVDAGVTVGDELPTDFCGRPRAGAPDVGAFERSAGADPGPLGFGAWSELVCGSDDPGDTGDADDSGGGGDSGDSGSDDPGADDSGAKTPTGCCCAHAHAQNPWGASALLLGLLLLRRR